MTKKIRLFLFLFFAVFFLILGPYIILYSLGYKIDFEKKRIVKTGGIYLEIQPPQVEIFINGKFKKRTGLFFNSVLMSGLLPKNYNILVKKEGYHPWGKTLEVKEEKVTKATNIFLIKESPLFETIEENSINYFFSPDNKKIAILKNTKNGIKFKILTNDKTKEKIISLNTENPEILNLKWAPNGKSFLVGLKSEGSINYFISESLDLANPRLIPLSSLSQNAKKISFHPVNLREFFYLENQALFSKNLNEQRKSKKVLENVISYDIFENNIYWLTTSGFFYKSDLNGKIIDVLNSTPFPVGENKNSKRKTETIEITVTPKTTFLKSGKALFFLNQKQKIFQELHDTVNNFLVSPDNKKLVFFNDYEIWLIEIDSLVGSNTGEKIDKLFLNRFSRKINNCFWLNPYYLIFNAGESIKVSEIDTRDKLNIVDLAEFENPKIFWSQSDKKLYILSKGNFFASEILLP